MLMSASPFVLTFSVSADEVDNDNDNANDSENNNANDNDNVGGVIEIYEAEQRRFAHFYYPEQKLNSMELFETYNEFELWANRITGEVAVRNTNTGDVLFSNPYDVAQQGLIVGPVNHLLSQLVVNFNEVRTGHTREFMSFTEAAVRGQISVSEIRNGIRVSYIIGQLDERRILPIEVEYEYWDTYVRQNPVYMEDIDISRRLSIYVLVDPWSQPEARRREMLEERPVFTRPQNYGHFRIRAASWDAISGPNRNRLEIIFRRMEWTLEKVEEAHRVTEFTMPIQVNPVFRVALEFRLDSDGLIVRLPANSISFNEEFFQLNHIEVLPFMGAAHNQFDGYTFFPDGSGTLIRAEDTRYSSMTVFRGMMYGLDQIYLDVPGMPGASDNRHHNPRNYALRMPGFGVVSNVIRYLYEDGTVHIPRPPGEEPPPPPPPPPPPADDNDEDNDDAYDNDNDDVNDTNDDVNDNDTNDDGNDNDNDDENDVNDNDVNDNDNDDDNDVNDNDNNEQEEHEVTAVSNRQGFFAVVTEGAALSEFITRHGGITHLYNTSFITVTPRQWDRFDIADAMGVGHQSFWTVVSRRRFTGNYTIRYFMLSDQEGEFEASVSGMADAYRTFLHYTGVLTRIENANSDMPLFIETLGTLATRDQFLTFPVWRNTPLTTFEDMMSMTERLSEEGITNLNFRLYGFANGGLASAIPNRLNFESAVGGDDGFADFVDFADARDIGVFLEFDLVTAQSTANHRTGFLGLGGGYRTSRHSARAINGMRGLVSIEYNIVTQMYSAARDNSGRLMGVRVIVSPGVYQYFFDQLATHLENFPTVSVASRQLGSMLNSDFNEDRPYNRADAQRAVERTLAAMAQVGDRHRSVMVDAGNAYVFQYADHIMSMPLTSSNLRGTHGSVPFMAMVLQGSTNFAGRPLNMSSSTEIEVLRAIENGSAPHFTVAYRNSHVLMNYLPRYFSIGFNIWFDEIVAIYNVLNENLADLQDQFMISHEFIVGERVPNEQEREEFAQRAEIIIGIAYGLYQEAQRAYTNATELHARLVAEGRIDAENVANTFYRNIAATALSLESARAHYELTRLTYATEQEAQYDEYGNFIPTRYTVQDSSIVMTTYENEVRFIINYNQFEITTVVDGTTHTVPALGFIRINP